MIGMDSICPHWSQGNIDRVADFAIASLTRPHLCWNNEMMCLHCGIHGFMSENFVQTHMALTKSKDHHLFLRPGDAESVELYCGICGDFQFSHRFDGRINKVRQFEPFYQTGVDNFSENTRSLRPRNIISRGICNLGSTCFMNAVLQVLLHNNFIIDSKLMQKSFMGNFPCKIQLNSDHSFGCIACELRNLNDEMHLSSFNSSLVPSNFLYSVWNFADYLAGYDQQDAHEFFIALLDGLSTHTNNNHIDSTKSVISDHLNWRKIFCGTMRSILKCMKCGRESYRDEAFHDLSLSLDADKFSRDSYISLTDCLSHFTTIEKLSEEIFCEKCNRNQFSQKKLSIVEFPSVLVLHLKRFNSVNKRKDTSIVKFPLRNLDLKPYSACSSVKSTDNLENSEINEILYDLQGLISHKGSLNQGHYIAYITRDNGDINANNLRPHSQWLKCDDDSVTKVSEEEVEKAEGYLLFYVKKKNISKT